MNFMDGWCRCHHKPVMNVSTRECDLDGCMYQVPTSRTNECEHWRVKESEVTEHEFMDDMPFGLKMTRDENLPWLLRLQAPFPRKMKESKDMPSILKRQAI